MTGLGGVSSVKPTGDQVSADPTADRSRLTPYYNGSMKDDPVTHTHTHTPFVSITHLFHFHRACEIFKARDQTLAPNEARLASG